jgi:hypothetical protein
MLLASFQTYLFAENDTQHDFVTHFRRTVIANLSHVIHRLIALSSRLGGDVGEGEMEEDKGGNITTTYQIDSQTTVRSEGLKGLYMALCMLGERDWIDEENIRSYFTFRKLIGSGVSAAVRIFDIFPPDRTPNPFSSFPSFSSSDLDLKEMTENSNNIIHPIAIYIPDIVPLLLDR